MSVTAKYLELRRSSAWRDLFPLQLMFASLPDDKAPSGLAQVCATRMGAICVEGEAKSDLNGAAMELLGTSADPIERLRAYQWDFEDSSCEKDDLHSLHPYPAKFIREIPRTLLQELPLHPGTCVFDPFCGSGTTLVEAQQLGLDSVGVDLNPIACLMSRVKTSPLPRGLIAAAHNCYAATHTLAEDLPQDIPNLSHWFKPEIARVLQGLRLAIEQVAPGETQDALRLALSSIIVRVSNQDSDTRYAAVEKKGSASQVLKLFLTACGRIQTALARRGQPKVEVKVVEADALTVTGDQIGKPVGLVITSPPYPNAYEYWLYHKYRMWWLGYDPIAVKRREIGARAHFFSGNGRSTDFLHQMGAVFKLLNQVCIPGAFVCFVVGDSKIHGRMIDNSAALAQAAHLHRFEVVSRIERTINSKRKSFNLSHARIKREHIVVFARTGEAP